MTSPDLEKEPRTEAEANQEARSTPGPWGWVVHDYSLASLGVLPDPGLGNPLVLAIGPCKACQKKASPQEWEWGRCHTPSEANAHLIAAAPELLKACEDFVAKVDYGAARSTQSYNQMKVAISKARGETP